MALSTLATSLGILAFAFMSSQTGTMLVSVWISFQGTLMYAIICECARPEFAEPCFAKLSVAPPQTGTRLACFPLRTEEQLPASRLPYRG